MNNKTAQQRLCTEPKEAPEEALKFAVAFEERISQQKRFSGGNETEAEPVYQINERVKNPCTRSGAEFTTNHLQRCKAIKEQCRSCGENGHFARMCRRVKPTNQRGNDNFRGNSNTAQRGGMRRINLIDQASNQSEDSTEDVAKNMILQVVGNGTPPFVLKGEINNVAFTTMIDSGSPITIFTQSHLGKILKTDVLFARPLPKGEEYVDYNGRPLNLLGFKTLDVKVGKKQIKKARVVITRDKKKSLIRRDWLTSLNFRVADTNNMSEKTTV